MADTKISDLAEATSLADTDLFVIAQEDTANKKVTFPTLRGEVVGDLFSASVTTDVTVSSTDVTAPTTIISLGAQTYAAVPTWFEFYCPAWSASASGSGAANVIALLGDGTTELCRIFDFRIQAAGAHLWGMGGIFARVLITPSAGTHTYLVGGQKGGVFGNVTFSAGNGTGGSSVYAPISLRAYLA